MGQVQHRRQATGRARHRLVNSNPTPDRTPPQPARRSAKAWAILVGVFFAGLALDLGLKDWSFANVADTPVVLDRNSIIANPNLNPIPPHHSVVVIGGVLQLDLVLNPGAVFGIGAEQRTFFVIFTLIAVTVCLTIFIRFMSARSTMALIGIALVLSGAVGNLWDRVCYGRVRDFLHLFPDSRLPFGWGWPGNPPNPEWFPWVFNIADVMLLTGMGLLLLHLHLSDRRAARASEANTDSNEA